MVINKLFINKERIDIHRDLEDEPTLELLKLLPTMHRDRTNKKWVTSTSNIELVLLVLRGITPDKVNELPDNIQIYYYYIKKRNERTKELLNNGPTGDHPFLMRHQLLGS